MLALACIFLAALVVRTYRLDNIPVGMTDDEVRIVESAYSLWHTGRDLKGVAVPFSFVLNDFSFTPVSIYMTAPFVGLLGLSPLTARLPFALAGFGVVVLTYLTAKRLFKNSTIGLIAAFVLTWNVWAIQLSRMAYEAIFALLFYLWGTYIFIGYSEKSPVRSIVWSMCLFFLAFNSYNAMKILIIPILFVLVWYRWKFFSRNRRFLAVIAGLLIATISTFLYFSVIQGASAHGGSITIFQDFAEAAQAVELERRASSAPEFLKVLYHNKATYYFDQVARHYLYAFSQEFLFLNQEASGIYSLWSRGNLYLIELPFLLIGIFALLRRHKKIFLLLAVMLLIAPLPSGVGPTPLTYATRSSFMLPWLMLFIAAGLYYFIETISDKYMKYTVIIFIVLLYALAIGGYLRQYYFEWPRYGAKSYAWDIKEVVRFIQSYRSSADNFLVGNTGDTFFLQYAFYMRTDPRQLQRAYKGQSILHSFDGVEVLPTCLVPKDQDPRAGIDRRTVYIAHADCHHQTPDRVIYFPDGLPAWHIYVGTR